MTHPTPLVPIQIQASDPVVWCKLEYLNPSGSTKDRIARFILDKAFAEGRISAGQTVIEASSGSTSIAFALACASHELRFIAVMPEGVSSERVLMIRAFGGDVRFTPKDAGVLGSIAESERLAAELGAFLPRQFANTDNALSHEIWTAGEILSQIPGGTVDAVVSGVGTGGTLVGLYHGLRKANTRLRPFLARPVEISEQLEQECSSFSSQIPGVVDGVSKLFREDLFQRLNGLTLLIPPLRERIQELPALIAAELRAAGLKEGKNITAIHPEAMEKLVRHPWRGNLRELSHTVRTMTLFCDGSVILPEHVVFPPDLGDAERDRPRSESVSSPATAGNNHNNDQVNNSGVDLTLASAVKRHVHYVYEQTNRNQRRTAKLLGISRATLARHLRGRAHNKT